MTEQPSRGVTPAEVNAELRRGLHLALLQRTDPEAFIREVQPVDVYALAIVVNWYAGGLAHRESAASGVEIDAEYVLRQGLMQLDVEDATRGVVEEAGS